MLHKISPHVLIGIVGLLIIFTTPNSSHSYPINCTEVPVGIVSWWPGDGNANDIIGGNGATIFGNLVFLDGKVGQAFNYDGVDDYIRVPASSNLNVQSLTISAWIFPTDLTIGRPIVEFSADSDFFAGVHFWISVPPEGGPIPLPGTIFANIRDIFGENHQFASAENVLTLNQWNHVAVTYDKQTGFAQLFVDGIVVSTENLGATLTLNTSVPIYLVQEQPRK